MLFYQSELENADSEPCDAYVTTGIIYNMRHIYYHKKNHCMQEQIPVMYYILQTRNTLSC